MQFPSINHNIKQRGLPAAKIYPSENKLIVKNATSPTNNILNIDVLNNCLLILLKTMIRKNIRPIMPVIESIANHDEPGSIRPVRKSI